MNARSRTRRTCATGAGASVLLLTLTLSPLTSTASAAPQRTYSGVVSAVGSSTVVENPGLIPFGAPLQGDAPYTISRLDSRGTSSSRAANPFPGDVVRTLPGAAGSLSGLPFPAYPLFAESTAQDPGPTEVRGSGYRLRVESKEMVTNALATNAEESPGGAVSRTSTSVTYAPDGSLTVAGTAVVTAVSPAPVLTLGEVRTEASMVQATDGTVTRKSSTSVTGMRVSGVAVAVENGVLVVAGTRQPLADNPTLTGALASQGLSVDVTKARNVDDPALGSKGLLSGGLVVTSKRAVEQGGVGTTTTRETLGLVAAEVLDSDSVPAPPGGGAPGDDAGFSAQPGAEAAEFGTAVDADAQSPVLAGGEGAAVSDFVASPGGGDEAPTVAAPEGDPTLDGDGSTPVALRAPFSVDVMPVFLALALAGLTLLGSAKTMQYVGIRSNRRWS